mmetsp:Transcript_28365/g.69092  ORF Transcript_28365/g.69092 Transcript_28365/m.69092 type:complete len:289 (-) Transcript_28365:562-1428(-)
MTSLATEGSSLISSGTLSSRLRASSGLSMPTYARIASESVWVSGVHPSVGIISTIFSVASKVKSRLLRSMTLLITSVPASASTRISKPNCSLPDFIAAHTRSTTELEELERSHFFAVLSFVSASKASSSTWSSLTLERFVVAVKAGLVIVAMASAASLSMPSAEKPARLRTLFHSLKIPWESPRDAKAFATARTVASEYTGPLPSSLRPQRLTPANLSAVSPSPNRRSSASASASDSSFTSASSSFTSVSASPIASRSSPSPAVASCDDPALFAALCRSAMSFCLALS